jgi:hypothetical protein
MATWRVFFIVKLMTIWNSLCEFYNNTTEKCQNFYYYIRDYIYGHHDMWLFIPGHSFPLSMSNLNNMIHVNWIYDNYDNTLTLGTTEDADLINCKFSWLSAKIRIYHTESENEGVEYIIDDFIEKFSVHTLENRVPTLYMIFMCWCASTKHWFKPHDRVEFHIIDDMGEEQILSIDDHNESLTIRRNKIYVVVDSGDENEVIEGNSEEKLEEKSLIEEKKNKED